MRQQMCVRETTFEDESYKKKDDKQQTSVSKKKSEFIFSYPKQYIRGFGLSCITLSVVIPNKRKRKRGGQPERREHHALTRIIGNTKGRVDRDSLYIYVIIVPDNNNNNNNNNNTINTINTNEDDYEMMLRV